MICINCENTDNWESYYTTEDGRQTRLCGNCGYDNLVSHQTKLDRFIPRVKE